MNAISIGPLVLPIDRFIALLVIGIFILAGEIWARRRGDDTIRQWSTRLVGIWVVAARAGFVIANLDAFRSAPWTILAIWQGGFSIATGTAAVAIAMAVMLWRQRGLIIPLTTSALIAAATFAVAIQVLYEKPSGTLPDIALPNMAGAPVQLSGFDGPVIVNLWATWCPPCQREMPMMVDFAQSNDAVRMIFANQGETTTKIANFLHQTGLSSDGMLLDQGGSLMTEFDVVGLPTTLFFDATGALQAAHSGEISRAALTNWTRSLMPSPVQN